MSDIKNIKRQFLNSLKRGTGEAYLLAKDNPQVDFSNQIIKGVLNIYAYDGQSENDRAKYIFDIISVSNKQDKIRNAILQGLAIEQDGTWNLTHLFALAKLFAEQGDREIKQAIYDRFCNYTIEGSDWVGYSEILKLDGLQGLIYIAEKFGKFIEQNPDDVQDDWIINNFQEENPNLKVIETLNKLAKENKHIRIYLDNIKQTKKGQEKYQAKHQAAKKQFSDITDEILNSKHFSTFFRELTNEEVNQVATRLLTEKNKQNIEKLLYIFDDYKYPFQSETILNFAKRKKTSKNRIVEYAIYALKHLKSNDIRNFTLDKIQNSKNQIDYLEILVSNYESSDFKILSELANKTNNEHKIEQLAGIFTSIYKANKTTECKEPLELLYNKMNCAIHRNGIIEILIENKILSDKIKSELKFDSYLETRKLAN